MQGQLSRCQILLPTSLPRQGAAISAADVGRFDQIGWGDVGRIDDPTSLELKAMVNTPEMPGRTKSGQYRGLWKTLSWVSKLEFICLLAYFCIQRSGIDFAKIS